MNKTMLNDLLHFNNIKAYQYLSVDIRLQYPLAKEIKSQNGLLLTEWIAFDSSSNETNWYVLYYYQAYWLCIVSRLNPKRPMLIDLSEAFPINERLHRAIHDLTKIPTKKAKDKRAWLNHGHFKMGILNPYSKSSRFAKLHYVFNKVSGEGVHEIPVGPVHAGIIEPGHFRFSIVGERILKLEDRLGYTHKGIHSLLINKSMSEAASLLGRVSGDTTVAYAYAFALACEKQLGFEIDAKTKCIRAILLERERLINHIGDIGAIINDTGFISLAMQFSILKEKLVRENKLLTHHRYMMDAISPQQYMTMWDKSIVHDLLNHLNDVKKQLFQLEQIYHDHHGLQDRLKTTGILTHTLAQSLGVLGIIAKASGIAIDARASCTLYPYSEIDFTPITAETGDVAARVYVRFRECLQSIDMIEQFLQLEFNNCTQALDIDQSSTEKISIMCVESWRGPICIAVQLHDTKVSWCHFHDPSWQNWPALSHAVMNNIVADFPLINKSFNLSYSGEDS